MGFGFFASVFVLVTHLELFKKIFGFPNVWDDPVINSFGSIGVDLFFVLSGFLITYLLLVEKKLTGNISFKDFFHTKDFADLAFVLPCCNTYLSYNSAYSRRFICNICKRAFLFTTIFV